MPLSADQRALIELLLGKGQTYGDIGALLEVSEAEVRAQSRQALTELGGADPDRNVGLTDWLLGQADPIGRADAARHVRDDPDDRLLAAQLADALRGIAPGAELPRVPGEPARGRLRRPARPAAASPQADASGHPPTGQGTSRLPTAERLRSFSPRQSRMLVALGSGAVILVAVVLAVAGVFGGDDEGSAADTTTTASDDGSVLPGDEQTASIPLRAVGGGDAEGSVNIGFTSGDQAYVEVTARNLQPAPNGSTYYVWFMQDERSGYPYQPLEVTGSEAASERFSLPNEALGIILSATTIDVWLSPIDELERRIPSALQEGEVVQIPGEPILSAPVQRAVEAAQGGSTGSG
jgi:hypothetical protein